MHAIGQLQMPQHHRTSANGAMRTDLGAACHTRTSSHCGVCAHVHVVSDLHQIVELDAVFDHGIFQGATIDTLAVGWIDASA